MAPKASSDLTKSRCSKFCCRHHRQNRIGRSYSAQRKDIHQQAQPSVGPSLSTFFLASRHAHSYPTDLETGVAAQLANVHPGACGIVQNEFGSLREQHGHTQAPVRRSFRLFCRTVDSDEDQKPKKPNVWRVLRNLQAMRGDLGGGQQDLSSASHSRNVAPVFELDPPGLHFRDYDRRRSHSTRKHLLA